MQGRAVCPPERDSRGGFALAAVLLVLVALTALATGGFLVANGDYRVSQYHSAGSRAFQTADAALHDYLGTEKRGWRTVGYTYSSGSATVVGDTLLDIGDGNVLFTTVSSSTHQPAGGGTAARTVRVVAMSSDATFRANAAFTSGSGLTKNGSSGSLDGNDQSTTAQCSAGPQPSVAGVATYPYTQNGNGQVTAGNPPADTTDTQAINYIASLGLDWDGIRSQTAVEPDFVIPTDPWPTEASIDAVDPDWWPVIYIDAATYDVDNVNYSGRGTIIARDDLTMNGNFSWRGIILVGGVFTSDGKQTIEGTTVTGLNRLPPLNQVVGQSSVGNGNKDFLFDSCWVRLAAQQFVGGLVPMPGTWSEGM